MLVIDKKTSNKRKKRFTKISSSDKNVVILFSETIKPVNEAEILEAKNNLKNISEHVNVEEIVEENEIEDEAVDQIDSYRKEDPKNGNDFPDNNSEINDTAEVVIEKRLKDIKKMVEEINDRKRKINDRINYSQQFSMKQIDARMRLIKECSMKPTREWI